MCVCVYLLRSNLIQLINLLIQIHLTIVTRGGLGAPGPRRSIIRQWWWSSKCRHASEGRRSTSSHGHNAVLASIFKLFNKEIEKAIVLTHF